MAIITSGHVFTPTEEVTAAKLAQLLSSGTVTGISVADLNNRAKDGSPALPSLRSLGPEPNQTAAGSHVHGRDGYQQIPTAGFEDGAITTAKLAAEAIPIEKGGLGFTTYNKGTLIVALSSTELTTLGVGTNGQVLCSMPESSPYWQWRNPVAVTSGPSVIQCTAPLTKTSNTTFADVPGMTFNILAGESWFFLVNLGGSQAAGGTGDIKLQWLTDTGSFTEVSLGLVGETTRVTAMSSPIVKSLTANTSFVFQMHLLLRVASSNCTVKLQMAQNVSNGSGVTLQLLSANQTGTSALAMPLPLLP